MLPGNSVCREIKRKWDWIKKTKKFTPNFGKPEYQRYFVGKFKVYTVTRNHIEDGASFNWVLKNGNGDPSNQSEQRVTLSIANEDSKGSARKCQSSGCHCFPFRIWLVERMDLL